MSGAGRKRRSPRFGLRCEVLYVAARDRAEAYRTGTDRGWARLAAYVWGCVFNAETRRTRRGARSFVEIGGRIPADAGGVEVVGGGRRKRRSPRCGLRCEVLCVAARGGAEAYRTGTDRGWARLAMYVWGCLFNAETRRGARSSIEIAGSVGGVEVVGGARRCGLRCEDVRLGARDRAKGYRRGTKRAWQDGVHRDLWPQTRRRGRFRGRNRRMGSWQGPIWASNRICGRL